MWIEQGFRGYMSLPVLEELWVTGFLRVGKSQWTGSGSARKPGRGFPSGAVVCSNWIEGGGDDWRDELVGAARF